MRTADDFDAFYRSADPWGISRARRRDDVLRRVVQPYTTDKSVLELGCGEGHLTAAVFSNAKRVRGIDISPVAVARAKARVLHNATFDVSDFLSADFSGFDVIAAIECLYYLSTSEQEAFFRKLVREHVGGIFILSAPIIGSNEHRTYYSHEGIEQIFARNDLAMIEWRNLNANRKVSLGATMAAAAIKLPFGSAVVDWLPQRWVYQRCYVARCPN